MNSRLDKAYEEMGRMNENQYKPIIKRLRGDVMKTEYKYCRVDFVGVDYAGELKSRDASILDYGNETMIGFNKLEEGWKKLEWYRDHIPQYKVYLWFAFKEGLYEWELNEENYKLNGGDIQKRMGGTSKRGKADYKLHYYIKKEFLTKIDDTPVWIHPLVAENNRPYKSSIPEGVCFLLKKKNPSYKSINSSEAIIL